MPMSQGQFPLSSQDGQELRERGMAAAQARAGPEWGDRCEFVIRLKAASGERFTSEDIRDVVGDPPSSGAMGALINAAARAFIIRQVDWAVPRRPQLHGHLIRVWQGIPEVERGGEN